MSTPQPRVLFGPRDNLLSHLSTHLASARHTIFVATYLLTNARLVHALLAAHKRNVTVQVVVDRGMAQRFRGRQVIRQLRTARIPTFLFASRHKQALMHHKFAVIDDDAWLGSANWTTAGMTRNIENVLVLHDRSLVQRLRTHFTTLKKRAHRMSVATTRATTDVLFCIPDHARYVKEQLLKALEAAQHRIWIASFELTNKQILSALQQAKKRGVSVRMLTNADGRIPRGAVPISVPQGCMHHKFMIIDAAVWTGSMNITRMGMSQHQESVIALSNAHLVKQYQQEFLQLWHRYATPRAPKNSLSMMPLDFVEYEKAP